ncbi:LTA synthase family protein [Heyndrickxia oleronia]|uniref:LTA synthase family protein n=1 Tax=Heyndrickxia oleronia TaxID=38875 RepID=UPI00204235FE|nr:LTA synthase family protein [Heyndrickxia oleronia]MCM3237001.1 LTA synthase family protein [Heyndrickxia oleronia]
MIKFKKMNILFPVIGAMALWIKTYLIYKTAFQIKIENWMQEFILFINPASFLLFVFGLSLFFKSEKVRIRYIVLMSVFLSLIIYANVVFYRFFTDYLTLPVLFQTSNFGDLGDSAVAEIHWWDFVYFIDVIILMLLAKFKPSLVTFKQTNRINRRAYFLVTGAVLFLNLGLAEAERPQLLSRTFDREILVKNIGSFNYHLYDIFLQSKTSAQKALADGSNLIDIENYVRANYAKPNEKLFGIAKGRNVIVISLESTQSFVINSKVNGQVITPFLNGFIQDSYYFDQFYHQTGQGKTSDSEFLVENSLFPLNRGAVFFTHASNEYNSLAEKLNQNGYFTAGMHANNKSFWNRDIMYKSLGYQRFYSSTSYSITDENSVGWGMKDIPFFEQSVDLMKNMPTPFYAKMLTLTNHHPFILNESDKLINEYTSSDKTVNRYFTTVRYQDEAIKKFIEELKVAGLYDHSIIVMYGDHYGISENHHQSMGEYLGKEITPYVNLDLQRVPFIIHIPGITDNGRGKVLSEVGGQIDMRPTILHLLGVDTKKDIQFGKDLFSPDHHNFTVLRDGQFITDKYAWAANNCYLRDTGEVIDKSFCRDFQEKANMELDYSDKIIYGDLLRFYTSTVSDNL